MGRAEFQVVAVELQPGGSTSDQTEISNRLVFADAFKHPDTFRPEAVRGSAVIA